MGADFRRWCRFTWGGQFPANNKSNQTTLALLIILAASWVQADTPTSNRLEPQLQSLSIPAANPNFEAAFQGECGKNNNSNPCEHICLDLHDGTYECSCFYGFTLAVDGYSCAALPAARQAASSKEESAVVSSSDANDKRVASGANKNLSRIGGEPLADRRQRQLAGRAAVDLVRRVTRRQFARPTSDSKAAGQPAAKPASKDEDTDPPPHPAPAINSASVRDSLLDLEFSDFDRIDLDEEEPDETSIRSIMRSNDQLLHQLAASLHALEQEEPPDSGEQNMPIVGQLNDEQDYELAKLEDLVRLTMQATQQLDANEIKRQASPQLAREINGPLSITQKLNRSSRQSSQDIGGQQLANDIDIDVDDDDCRTQVHTEGANYGPNYRDCEQMPECESGGRCLEEPASEEGVQTRARCQCPIGRGGLLCQKPIQRSEPKFSGRSYLALPMITQSWITKIRLVFKPMARSRPATSSLLLSSRDFLLILDELDRIELRYFATNSQDNQLTRVIGSRDVVLGQWNELIVTDASSDAATSSDATTTTIAAHRILLVTPDRIKLSGSAHRDQLFVAGLPEAAISQHRRAFHLADTRPAAGFVGCISRLEIEPKDYNLRSDLEGDALDGFDIGECAKCRQ